MNELARSTVIWRLALSDSRELKAQSINNDWYESMLKMLDSLGIVRTPIPGLELLKGEFWRNERAERAEQALQSARSQREASIVAERKDCEKALVALAGIGYPTPVKTYGTNSSWAISDLCRALKEKVESVRSEERKRCLAVLRSFGGISAQTADEIAAAIEQNKS